MVLFRALGWLFLAMTVATAVQNGLIWWSEGAFRLLALADVWAHFDYGSLLATQAFLTHYLSAQSWTWGAQPILHLPAVAVFFILGVFCLWMGQPSGEGRRRERRPSDFSVGSHRPKRRRGRGLS